MNEQINKLRLEAGISQLQDDPRLIVINKEGNVIDPLIGLERFAELIVKECMELGDKALQDGKWPGDVLKEHFGIEE